jgi:hypothetical protein
MTRQKFGFYYAVQNSNKMINIVTTFANVVKRRETNGSEKAMPRMYDWQHKHVSRRPW